MTRAKALKVLEKIPWNRLRHRERGPDKRYGGHAPPEWRKPTYVSVALSEEQMQAIAYVMTLLRDVMKVEHTMALEGQNVEIGCICKTGFGANLSCPVHKEKS